MQNGCLTHLGPVVSVLARHDANARCLFGNLVDASELLLELRRVELLAIDLVSHLEELVLADDGDVLVLVGSVLLCVVGGLGGDAAAVEHVLVAAHGNGQLLHVLGLQSALDDLLPEVEHRSGDGGGALGRVSSLAVVAVAVKVGDVGHDGVTVGQVRGIVPPLVNPVLDVGVFSACNQPLLQFLAEAVGRDEVVDGLFGILVLLLAEKRVDGSEVALGRLFQRGYGQTGQ